MRKPDTHKFRSGVIGNRRGPTDLDPLLTASELKSGDPIPIEVLGGGVRKSHLPDQREFRALQTEAGCRTDQGRLDFTDESLFRADCAEMIAHRCNEQKIGEKQGISRFVALPHTEGCGVSSGRSEEIYTRTMNRTPHTSDSRPRSAP